MEQKKEEMQPQTRAYTVEEIAAILHIGRSSAYTLVRKGYFKSVRIGTAIRCHGKTVVRSFALQLKSLFENKLKSFPSYNLSS